MFYVYCITIHTYYMWLVCRGNIPPVGPNNTMDFVNAYNIDSFRGCQIIEGHLKLINWTLRGLVCSMLIYTMRHVKTIVWTFNISVTVSCIFTSFRSWTNEEIITLSMNLNEILKWNMNKWDINEIFTVRSNIHNSLNFEVWL